jgi:hydrogenase large subunit
MARIELNLDLNRVEGDLSVQVTLEDGVVVAARTQGTMYRGFEQILLGRAPRDAMVITPRVCGICGTAHLYAGVLALEQIWSTPVPPNATRIRNLCLIAEGLQNDLRQTFFFAPDLCHPRYAADPLHAPLMAAFEPFKGDVYRETLAQTRQVLQIVAHFGGQWPHSSYMLPGGVVTPADTRRLVACRSALLALQRWYEQRILGGGLDAWLALDSAEAFEAWLAQPGPAAAALGLLTRFLRGQGLDRLGRARPTCWPSAPGASPRPGRVASRATPCRPASWMATPARSSRWTRRASPSMCGIPGSGPTRAVATPSRARPCRLPARDRPLHLAKAPRYDGRWCRPGRWPSC